MNARDRLRLAAILLPILDGEAQWTDADHAELRRMIAPPPPPWPYDGPPPSYGLSREEAFDRAANFPLQHLEAIP